MLTVQAIEGNRQRLDGGALFGNAPRALWQRWHPPDEVNRIETACRALLVREAGRTVLLETGIGAFFPPQLKERFGVYEEQHVLLASLAAAGVAPEDVDVIILSHLHFDHAGGLLSAYEDGKAPELAFPRASFYTSEQAFARASAPHPRDRASFIPELPALLERTGRLRLVPEGLRQVDELGPSFSFTQTNGHTLGMLHTTLHGSAHSLFFAADLIPGRAWLPTALSMGYDRFPERLVDEKAEILEGLERSQSWVFYTHDPEVAASQVQRDARGRFTAGATAQLTAPWSL